MTCIKQVDPGAPSAVSTLFVGEKYDSTVRSVWLDGRWLELTSPVDVRGR